jgi:hypothetical protein
MARALALIAGALAVVAAAAQAPLKTFGTGLSQGARPPLATAWVGRAGHNAGPPCEPPRPLPRDRRSYSAHACGTPRLRRSVRRRSARRCDCPLLKPHPNRGATPPTPTNTNTLTCRSTDDICRVCPMTGMPHWCRHDLTPAATPPSPASSPPSHALQRYGQAGGAGPVCVHAVAGRDQRRADAVVGHRRRRERQHRRVHVH